MTEPTQSPATPPLLHTLRHLYRALWHLTEAGLLAMPEVKGIRDRMDPLERQLTPVQREEYHAECRDYVASQQRANQV